MKGTDELKVCTRCLMDTSDSEIVFTEEGICNHCIGFLDARKPYLNLEDNSKRLTALISKIKSDGVGKKYDVIAGVSGGVDSTYVVYIAKSLGLRVLAVHVDNGWNSELAVNNIENVLNKLNIPLYTHVIEWDEFRDLQLSMLKASVSDAELPTDHAIRAVLMEVASREGVRYMLNGRNFVTEGILPWSWTYSGLDWKYLSSIQKQFGSRKIRNYPHLSLLKLFWYVVFKRIKNIGILNYLEFSKESAMNVLTNELGWRDYGGKHYESIYTRFFQGYILPKKFSIDKRKAHLSVLVMTGQLQREEALKQLSDEEPLDSDIVKNDKIYVAKKLGITEEEFDSIMRAPLKDYHDYPNRNWLVVPHKNRLSMKLIKLLRKIGVLPRGFAENLIDKEKSKELLAVSINE